MFKKMRIHRSARFKKAVSEHFTDFRNMLDFLGVNSMSGNPPDHALTGRRLLATCFFKAGGKTRTVNFYLIRLALFYLVGLPGYGYAVAGIKKRAAYGGYIEEISPGKLQSKNRHSLLVDTKVGSTEMI